MRKILLIALLLYHSVGWGQNTIRSYEYWFDGSFTIRQQQSVTPVAQYTLNTMISATSLTEGLHSFNLRFKDDSARYSSTISQFFYKQAAGNSPVASINAYQYWFDNDFAGSALQSVTGTGTLNLQVALSAAALTNGLHLFHLRFRDNSNQWSGTVSQFFYKAVAAGIGDTNEMNAYQYWFDDTFNQAQVVPVSPVGQLQLSAALPAATLSNGLHTLHIRFRDKTNQWSSIVSQFFYKAVASGIGGTNEMNAYQYWFDDTFNQAQVVTVSPVGQLQLSAALPAATLSNGLHTLHIRFRDKTNQWSSTLSQFVYKGTAAATANNAMSKMQYWFDDHFDSATSKAIAVQPMVSVTDLLSTTSLPDGLHTLHLRFADTLGQWSSTLSQFFYKSAAIGVTSNVVSGYRYWFNNDDATKMVIHNTPPQNPLLLNINLDMGCLTVGENRLHLQFKDARGLWSSALTDTVTTSTVPSNTYRFTGNGNWSNASNWQNNAVPALDLPGCKEIIIDHAVGGQCILDVPQYLLKNARLTVLTGKRLVIPQQLGIK